NENATRHQEPLCTFIRSRARTLAATCPFHQRELVTFPARIGLVLIQSPIRSQSRMKRDRAKASRPARCWPRNGSSDAKASMSFQRCSKRSLERTLRRSEMFIAQSLVNYLKLLQRHVYLAPKGVKEKRAVGNYKYRASNGAQSRLERNSTSMTMKIDWMRGCATALVTPFRSDGAIDEERMRALVDRQIKGGVRLLVPCGTTGESATMTEE